MTEGSRLDRSMRLVLVVNRFPTLSETGIFNKAQGLRTAGWDVQVVAHGRSADAPLLDPGETAPPVRYALVSRGRARSAHAALLALWHPSRAWNTWRAIRERASLPEALRTWSLALPLIDLQADIIHFESSGLAVTYLAALPYLRPARLIASCRGSAEKVTPIVDGGRRELLVRSLEAMDRVHCVSRDMLEHLAGYGFPRERLFVIHPAVDAERRWLPVPRNPPADGRLRVVAVGRLHWVKGLDTLLQALRDLLREGLDVRVDLVGTGPERERLAFLAHTFGIHERVHFLGAHGPDGVRSAIGSADVFVLTSLSEGLNNATLEAMAMEIPVVVSAVGGMPEAVTDGCEGFLVPPGDATALASRLCELARNPALRSTMGKNGRRRVQASFDLSPQVASFLNVYRELLGRASSS